MKSLNSKVFMILLAGLWTGSVSAQEGSGYMLDMAYSNLHARSTVRVKVFPHDKDYKPQGLDSVRDRFVIDSLKSCSVYAAGLDRANAQGAALRKGQHLEFDAKSMQQGAVVRCQGPFKLLRSGGVPSFEYSGSLYVRPVAGELEAINFVELESYLQGVVPSEVYRDWPMETLKTQAVAARTYAIYHVLNARRIAPERLWDVDDSINFQAYTGTSLHSDRTNQAIAETSGQILTYRGQVIQAFYHADSGGLTEEASAVWNQAIPFTVSRPEAQETELSKTIWERSVNLKQAEQELRSQGILEKDRSLKSLLVPLVGRTSSGRVKSLAMVDNRGEYKALSVQILRKLIGSLPSPLFTLERDAKDPHNLIVRGIGFGHGVGMSQQGAAALASQRSWNYRQILDYYYIQTTLCSLQDAGRTSGISQCESGRGVAQAK